MYRISSNYTHDYSTLESLSRARLLGAQNTHTHKHTLFRAFRFVLTVATTTTIQTRLSTRLVGDFASAFARSDFRGSVMQSDTTTTLRNTKAHTGLAPVDRARATHQYQRNVC